MKYKTTVEQEHRLYKIFGFTPLYWAMPSLELMLNVATHNETEKYLKDNVPYEWLRYVSNNLLHNKLEVNDYVMTLRGGFSSSEGGGVLKVYDISKSGVIYLCTLGCKDPFNEEECKRGERFCITKDEVFDSVLYLRDFEYFYNKYFISRK
jgi:hypothetical protein